MLLCSEFVILGDGAEIRFNSLQEVWLRQMLDLQIRVHRVLLLQELGFTRRLLAVILRRAFGLWARIEFSPNGSKCRKVAEVAATHHNTWTAALTREAETLGVLSPHEGLDCDHALSRSAPSAVLSATSAKW